MLCDAGVDVVFDPVGGPLFTEALKCVRWGAHILVIGFAAGVPKLPVSYRIDAACSDSHGSAAMHSVSDRCIEHEQHGVGLAQANIIMVKNVTVHGVYWGSYAMHSPRPLRRSLEDSIQWLGDGKVRQQAVL